jgi:hypothetical protein
MSTALDTAITARLTGTEVLTSDGLLAQQALAALLATDPDTSKPAVFKGNYSDLDPVVYPVITFRESAGSIDRRFRRSTGVMTGAVYSFEIWDNSRDGRRITNIEEYLQQLLDDSRATLGSPLMTLSAGKLFESGVHVPLQIVYDRDYNAWAGLVLYHFRENRY